MLWSLRAVWVGVLDGLGGDGGGCLGLAANGVVVVLLLWGWMVRFGYSGLMKMRFV